MHDGATEKYIFQYLFKISIVTKRNKKNYKLQNIFHFVEPAYHCNHHCAYIYLRYKYFIKRNQNY